MSNNWFHTGKVVIPLSKVEHISIDKGNSIVYTSSTSTHLNREETKEFLKFIQDNWGIHTYTSREEREGNVLPF